MSEARIQSRALSILGPLAGLSFVYVLFLFLNHFHPPSLLDLRTVAVHAILVSIVGVAMTLVIISGGIDLSVGSSVALTGVVAALVSRAGWGIPAMFLAALGTGALCGLYNGLLIGPLRLPPFIVTLGTLGFFRGLAKWLAGSGTISAPTHGLDHLMQPVPEGHWLIAPGAWISISVALIVWSLLNLTVLGRQVVALGDNQTAARYSGIPIARRRIQVYTIAGVFVGLAGLLQFGRVTVADSVISSGLELEAIAAAVIGGASLAGGTGSVWGTVIGAFMMAYLSNRFDAVGWPNFVQEMIVGHIIIIAVAIDMLRRRRSVT